jgi:hypothetical protein
VHQLAPYCRWLLFQKIRNQELIVSVESTTSVVNPRLVKTLRTFDSSPVVGSDCIVANEKGLYNAQCLAQQGQPVALLALLSQETK